MLGTTRRGRNSDTKARSSVSGEWRARGTSCRNIVSGASEGVSGAYQVVYFLSVQQPCFRILDIQLPALVAHVGGVDVHDAVAQAGDGIVLRPVRLVIHSHVVASVEPLTCVETRRGSILSRDRAQEWVGGVVVYRVLVSVDVNLDGPLLSRSEQ